MAADKSIPVSSTVQAAEKELSQDIVVATLPPEEQKKIEEIKKTIDLNDTQLPINYGVAIQKNVSQFADNILKEIRNKDSGAVGELLSGLMQNVRGVDVDSLSGKSKGFLSRLFGKLVDEGQRFMAQYEKLGGQIDRITDKLDQAQLSLGRDQIMLDNLFEKNREFFRDLNFHIAAAELKLKEAKEKTLPEMETKARAAADMVAQQALSDFKQAVNRFEKRVHDLKLTRMITLQTIPQIRIIQNGNHELISKIQSSILNTVPLWKNQIVVAISLYRQRLASKLQQNVSDTTNSLLQKNAELLKQNSIDVARESERGVVDVETLKKVNDDLISTIEETLKIQEEGRQKRAIVERELNSLETQLKDKLTSFKK